MSNADLLRRAKAAERDHDYPGAAPLIRELIDALEKAEQELARQHAPLHRAISVSKTK